MNEIDRWLLCTHHLIDWSGSEVVLLELARELLRRGVAVTISASFYDSNFVEGVLPEGAQFLPADQDLRIQEFSVVYCQHQSVSKHLANQKIDVLKSASRPIFIYNHLSPYEPFEFPGPFIEEHFADIVLANSAETLASLQRFGEFFSRTKLFQNPAPPHFSSQRSDGPQLIRRVLSVTNHPPEELTKALNTLEGRGVEVTRIGRKTGQRQLLIDDLLLHDAVVTIGKTVQYAFRAGVPVYCYDKFAGPGWITTANLEEAERTNFSGRCSSTRRAPDAIAQEIISRHGDALVFSETPERFCLETQVDLLLDSIDERLAGRRALDIADRRLQEMLIREQGVYGLADKLYSERLTARNMNRVLRERLQEEGRLRGGARRKRTKLAPGSRRQMSWLRRLFRR